MRCKACDKELSDFESTYKDKQGEFYDLCNRCLGDHWKTLAELDETDEFNNFYSVEGDSYEDDV